MILHQILFIYFQTSQKSITIINKIFENRYQYTSNELQFPSTIESATMKIQSRSINISRKSTGQWQAWTLAKA